MHLAKPDSDLRHLFVECVQGGIVAMKIKVMKLTLTKMSIRG